jgi:hypothetical protein
MTPTPIAQGAVVSDISQYLEAFSIRSVEQYFPEIWSILIIFAVVLALIIIIIGAIQWIVSGDNKESLTSARNKIFGGLIGLLIVLSAWVIADLVMGAFGLPLIGKGTSGVSGRCAGTPGQDCDNINKCDIAGGCNPGCCAGDGDCPSGQRCNIPNGYCIKGKSCNPSAQGKYHKDCVGNQCVYVPGEGSDKCTSASDCQ